MYEFKTTVMGLPVTITYHDDLINGRGPDDDYIWPTIDKVLANLKEGQKDLYSFLTTEQLSQLEWQIAQYEKRKKEEDQYDDCCYD